MVIGDDFPNKKEDEVQPNIAICGGERSRRRFRVDFVIHVTIREVQF